MSCSYIYSLKNGRITGFPDLPYHIFWFNIVLFKTNNIKTMQLKNETVSFMELAFKNKPSFYLTCELT